MPNHIMMRGQVYSHAKTFKHDFFAATGLYQAPVGNIVLKVGREADLFGFPMAWVGRFLSRREARHYQRLDRLDGIPRFVGIWGKTGMAHEYIPGRPLAKGHRPDENFFPALSALIDQIHCLDVAYVDLEKPENILLGEDGRPYLIDFQISWYWPPHLGGGTWPARKLLNVLQTSDRYHLLKHWRRAYPEQLDERQITDSYRAPFWIIWHRALARPLTRLRRLILTWLGARSTTTGRSPG